MPSFLHTYFLLLCPEHLYFLTRNLSKPAVSAKCRSRFLPQRESPSSRCAPPKKQKLLQSLSKTDSAFPFCLTWILYISTILWQFQYRHPSGNQNFIARRKYGSRSAATFLISIAASVAGYYICKWLDRNRKDSQPKRNPMDWSSMGFHCVSLYHHFLGYYYSITN